MSSLEAPKNNAVDVMKVVIDTLVQGVGVDAAVAAGIAAWPFLSTPIVRQLFTWAVKQLADVIDQNLGNFAMKLVIRIQSDALKDEFNEALIPILSGEPTEEELDRARRAADGIIERSRL